jgi:hypothetical protein
LILPKEFNLVKDSPSFHSAGIRLVIFVCGSKEILFTSGKRAGAPLSLSSSTRLLQLLIGNMRDQILIEEHVTFYITTRETLALANSQLFFLPLCALQKKWASRSGERERRPRTQMPVRAGRERKREEFCVKPLNAI